MDARVFSVSELSILSPLTVCIFMYLELAKCFSMCIKEALLPRQHTRSSSTSIIVSTCPLPVHILLIGPYTSIYYKTLTVGWLIRGSRQRGEWHLRKSELWSCGYCYLHIHCQDTSVRIIMCHMFLLQFYQ